ncbi:hypothetical protein TrRE_jg2122, partial [Triparma retinervis]
KRGTRMVAKIYKLHGANDNYVISDTMEWKSHEDNADDDQLTNAILHATKRFLGGEKGQGEGGLEQQYLKHLTKAAKFTIDQQESKDAEKEKGGRKRSSKKKGGGEQTEARVNLVSAPTRKFKGNKLAKLSDTDYELFKGAGACFTYVKIRKAGGNHKEACDGCKSDFCERDRLHATAKGVYDEYKE